MAGLEFQSTNVSDLEDIATTLIAGFNAPADAPFANRELLWWKYFEAGPDWNGSRSYVLRKDKVIKAHCGIWPINLSFADTAVTSNAFVDWISDRRTPGAGVLLKKKLMALAETGVVIGGTKDTRAVVPRIGFEHVGEVVTFARVIRPLRQFMTRPKERVVKATLRLARNTSWSLRGKVRVPPTWKAESLESFRECVNRAKDTLYPTPIRTAEYLNYWLRLPANRISAFSIVRDKQMAGYFLLSKVGYQTRIADIRIDNDDEADWGIAYSLATDQAGQDKETCEILAIASTPFARKALKANGFRERGSDPLFVYDPKRRLKGAEQIFLNLIDGDGAYLFDPNFPYVT